MAHATGKALFLLPLFLVTFVACCHRQQPRAGLGDEWLSWSLAQRQAYVGGFLDGSSSTQAKLCLNLEEESGVEVFKTRNNLGSLEEVCRKLSRQYSKVHMGEGIGPYTSAYVSVIDDFYKHPECRVMPYTALLEHLNDKEYRSGEDLYKSVRSGEISMGGFSGFDGMENCYGATSSSPPTKQ